MFKRNAASFVERIVFCMGLFLSRQKINGAPEEIRKLFQVTKERDSATPLPLGYYASGNAQKLSDICLGEPMR